MVMKVARFSRFGPPDEVTECVEVADPPAPAADEVALEVLAFPINPADTLMIEGLYAAGNVSAPVMGHTYPGPGGTIGPAMLFGYLAALHLAGKG